MTIRKPAYNTIFLLILRYAQSFSWVICSHKALCINILPNEASSVIYRSIPALARLHPDFVKEGEFRTGSIKQAPGPS
jgi:hypothetical protein